MFRSSWRWTLVAVLLAGCSGGSTPSETVDPERPAGAETTASKKTGGAVRTSPAGRWMLMVSAGGAEHPLLLLDIEPDGKAAKGTLVSAIKQLPAKPELESVKVDGDSVEVDTLLKSPQLKQDVHFNFQGTYKDGEIRGNLQTGPFDCSPARLVASESKSLKDAEGSPFMLMSDFMKAGKSKEPVKELTAFAKKNPTSPLALDAYMALLSSAKQHKLDDEQIRALGSDLVAVSKPWGPRLENLSRVKVGLVLAETQYKPELATELLEDAETKLGNFETPQLRELIESGKKMAAEVKTIQDRQKKIEEARKQLAGDDEEQKKQAYELLTEMIKETPYDPMTLYALAQYAEKAGKTDEALDYYGRLDVYPGLAKYLEAEWAGKEEKHESIEDAVARLWKEKKGSDEGLEAYLDDVWRKSLYSFVGEKAEPRSTDDGNRTVLVELFTGAQCPPCVAADVATGGLEQVFDRKDVIVLRYHQHIPKEDPLANADSETRFTYYQAQGTPTTLVDGVRAEVGGFLPHVPIMWKPLRERVEKELKTKTEIVLTLSAEAKDGELHVSAEAAGLPEEGDLKLRMALAEAEIAYPAPNGIRLHEMVVRSMPGTSAGVSAENGKLAYTGTIKLPEFRRDLADYLAGFEEQQNLKFDHKPLALDKLVFVAFVQDDKTREVLQAASIPVSGVIEYPKEKAPKPPEEKKDDGKEPEKKEPAKTE